MRDGRAGAVETRRRRTQTEAALDKINAVARIFAFAVSFAPKNFGTVNAGLHNEIFRQASERVVGERGHNRGFLPKGFRSVAGDVVFSAAVEDAKILRRVNALVARIEAQQNFAQGNQIPTTLIFYLLFPTRR